LYTSSALWPNNQFRLESQGSNLKGLSDAEVQAKENAQRRGRGIHQFRLCASEHMMRQQK
jgi:hypothetical protein